MVLGSTDRLSRSLKNSHGRKPLELTGQKLRAPVALGALRHEGWRLEGWNGWGCEASVNKLGEDKQHQRRHLVQELPEEYEEHGIPEDLLLANVLCQRIELRRLVEGAAEYLQGESLSASMPSIVAVPQAAERLNAVKRWPAQGTEGQRERPLVLSGQTLPLRRSLAPLDPAEASQLFCEDNEGVAGEQDFHNHIASHKHAQARSGHRARSHVGKSHDQRITFIGHGSDDNVIGELVSKLGNGSADARRLSPSSPKQTESETLAEKDHSKKKSTSAQARYSPTSGEGNSSIADSSSAKGSEDIACARGEGGCAWTAPLNIQGESWATPSQSPQAIFEPNADLQAESRSLRKCVRSPSLASPQHARPASSPHQDPRPASSPHRARGRPAMSKAASSPMLLEKSSSSPSYVEICCRVPVGTDCTLEAHGADAAEVIDTQAVSNANRILCAASDGGAESVQSSPTSRQVAALSRPQSPSSFSQSGSVGRSPVSSSKSVGSRRGGPLNVPAGWPLVSADSHGNMFGVVSRSRNFAQGTPTDLRAAISSPGSQAPKSKNAKLRSSSSAGRLCSGSRQSLGETLAVSGSGSSGRGLPKQ